MIDGDDDNDVDDKNDKDEDDDGCHNRSTSRMMMSDDVM
jgi:hypothetical protein